MARQFRVQIPQELLDAGFPVEWLVIDDSGTVTIHYSTPVLLDNVTVDDRPIINLSTGLKLLIGTGETMEVQMQLAEPFMAGLHDDRCPNCNQPMPEQPLHPWSPECPSPNEWRDAYGSASDACALCARMADARAVLVNYKASLGNNARMYKMEVVADGVCRYCGQAFVGAELLAEATKLVAAGAKVQHRNTDKAQRLLERKRRKLK